VTDLVSLIQRTHRVIIAPSLSSFDIAHPVLSHHTGHEPGSASQATALTSSKRALLLSTRQPSPRLMLNLSIQVPRCYLFPVSSWPYSLSPGDAHIPFTGANLVHWDVPLSCPPFLQSVGLAFHPGYLVVICTNCYEGIPSSNIDSHIRKHGVDCDASIGEIIPQALMPAGIPISRYLPTSHSLPPSLFSARSAEYGGLGGCAGERRTGV